MRECRLTDEQKGQATAAMLAEIAARDTFTFLQLHAAGDRATGVEGESYRLADRLLQKERKAGRIRQARRGLWEKVQ